MSRADIRCSKITQRGAVYAGAEAGEGASACALPGDHATSFTAGRLLTHARRHRSRSWVREYGPTVVHALGTVAALAAALTIGGWL